MRGRLAKTPIPTLQTCFSCRDALESKLLQLHASCRKGHTCAQRVRFWGRWCKLIPNAFLKLALLRSQKVHRRTWTADRKRTQGPKDGRNVAASDRQPGRRIADSNVSNQSSDCGNNQVVIGLQFLNIVQHQSLLNYQVSSF